MSVVMLSFLTILMFGTMGAQASLIDEIPAGVNDALFDGENIVVAELLISVAVIVSAGFALAAARMDLIPIVIVLFAVMGLLTALGWLDYWLMLVGVIVFAAMFGSKMTAWLGSRGGD